MTFVFSGTIHPRISHCSPSSFFLLLQRIRAVHFVVASDDTNYDLLYALAPPPTQTFCLLSCAELYDSALTRSPDCPSIYVNKLATAVQNDDCMRK